METNDNAIESQYIIETLIEENRNLNENRLYLMAALRQVKAEFEASRKLWEAEKESLTKTES